MGKFLVPFLSPSKLLANLMGPVESSRLWSIAFLSFDVTE